MIHLGRPPRPPQLCWALVHRQNGQSDRGGGYLHSFEVPSLEPVLITDATGRDISLQTLDRQVHVAQAVLDNKAMAPMPVSTSV